MAYTGTARSDAIRDQRIERVVPLVAPQALIEELPLSDEHAATLLRGRSEVQAILERARRPAARRRRPVQRP